MANNILGTNIVILSTDEYRRLLAVEHTLNNLIEFQDSFWGGGIPRAVIKLGPLQDQIKAAWDRYVPKKDSKVKKSRLCLDMDTDREIEFSVLSLVDEDEGDKGDNEDADDGDEERDLQV